MAKKSKKSKKAKKLAGFLAESVLDCYSADPIELAMRVCYAIADALDERDTKKRKKKFSVAIANNYCNRK